MSKALTITANTSILAMTTHYASSGISVVVSATSDLGGGALTLQVRPARSNVQAEEVEALTVGQKDGFLVGGDMEVFITLTGATSPNVVVFVSELRG